MIGNMSSLCPRNEPLSFNRRSGERERVGLIASSANVVAPSLTVQIPLRLKHAIEHCPILQELWSQVTFSH